jgi:hypothetical protein
MSPPPPAERRLVVLPRRGGRGHRGPEERGRDGLRFGCSFVAARWPEPRDGGRGGENVGWRGAELPVCVVIFWVSPTDRCGSGMRVRLGAGGAFSVQATIPIWVRWTQAVEQVKVKCQNELRYRVTD